MPLITHDLYQEALLAPFEQYGADTLQIITGYASAAMALHHLEKLVKTQRRVKVSLLIGMSPLDGMAMGNHGGFQELCCNPDYKDIFSCSYLSDLPPVHSKMYIWSKGDTFHEAFIGSANYTQNAFLGRQREVLAALHDEAVLDYYRTLADKSVFCTHPEIENLVTIYSDKQYYRRAVEDKNPYSGGGLAGLESVRVSLLIAQGKKKGEVHGKGGGLNWGFRGNRNRNEAYLQLSKQVYTSDFFPIRGEHFNVLTDDGKGFILTRAQKDERGHALETPAKNAILGEYFRHRLGVSSDTFITRAMLNSYGRTDVEFTKLDSEYYYMDFSV